LDNQLIQSNMVKLFSYLENFQAITRRLGWGWLGLAWVGECV